jgi:hypothetical protein
LSGGAFVLFSEDGALLWWAPFPGALSAAGAQISPGTKMQADAETAHSAKITATMLAMRKILLI